MSCTSFERLHQRDAGGGEDQELWQEHGGVVGNG